MKIMLANPYMLRNDPREKRQMQPYAPLGPLYIAAVLKSMDVEVKFHDSTFESNLKRFESSLSSHKPDILGVYTTMASRDNALRMAASARSQGIRTVVGGPDATTYPEQYIEGGFDVAVAGEGEITIKELVEKLDKDEGEDVGRVKGLVYRNGEKVVRTEPRGLNKHLDEIPFPDRSHIELDKYRARWQKRHGYFNMSILGSRGCPYNCKFCSRPVFGNRYRPRSAENILAELQEIAGNYKPNRVKFADDILPVSKRRTIELCELISKEKLDLEFECLSRMNLMDKELLRSMSKAGFRKVYYGVESGSQTVLDAMCKGQSVDMIRDVGKLTGEQGIAQHWYLMLGYPGESASDIDRTINLIEEVMPEEFSTTIAQPIRGTEFYTDMYGESDSMPSWKQGAGTQFAFKNRYPKAFYKWSILRMHLTHALKKRANGSSSGLLRLNSKLTGSVSKILSVKSG
jgi:radical SAM superfamily enzyme YgiQ (UPF0313 family)